MSGSKELFRAYLASAERKVMSFQTYLFMQANVK